MKKLIFKKIIIDISKFFLVSWLAIGVIVWIIQAVNYLDFMVEDGHSFKIYILYSILNFPKILHRLLPFIFFISLAYNLIKYENNNELMIFWTTGISKQKFLNHIIIYSLIVCFFQMILGTYISPFSQNEARSYIRNSDMSFLPSLMKERKFIDGVEDLTIFIEKKTDDGKLKNIYIKENVKKSNSLLGGSYQITYAKEGQLIFNNSNKYFELYNGQIVENKSNEITTISFDQINFNLNRFKSNTTTYPKLQEAPINELLKCIYLNYINKIDEYNFLNLNCVTDRIPDIKQEINKRFLKPIYIPLLALSCCFLILFSKENKKYNRYKYLVFISCFSLIVFSEISLRYTLVNNGTIIFMIIPLIFFLLSYLYLSKSIQKLN
ncbi:LptF/LptG family permease [Candidatus Pelagibacter sp.]|uniref:LptF/LptG family permease n=1 Tax=Candidatus Pelagibacter sp. TaxID=2024849 RepID=UPI003F830C22